MTLVEPRRYLPFTGTYSMPGSQPKLGTPGHGDLYIEADLQLDHYRAAKAAVAARWPACRAADTEHDERTVAIWLREKIDRDCPGLLAHAGAAELTLDELMALIQEDLVIMRKADSASAAAGATADYLHVSFPSSWCPTCALGKTFEGIHRAVPESGSFTVGQRRGRAGTLFARATTVRFVWTLTPDAGLDRRKCHAATNHGTVPAPSWRDTAGTAFLRVERQVVAPIDERLSIFSIRTYLYPVSSLTQEERTVLRSSVASMSLEVATYKSFADAHADNREEIYARLAS